MANYRKAQRPTPDEMTAEVKALDDLLRSYLEAPQLAGMLRVGVRTVQRKAQTGEWPHHRFPGRGTADMIRFSPDDVREILELVKRERQPVRVPAAKRTTKPRRKAAS